MLTKAFRKENQYKSIPYIIKFPLTIVRNRTIILVRGDKKVNIRCELNKAYNELNGLYHDISLKLGLSDSESMVMYMLYDEIEPLTQSDIVKATGLSKQTLNSTIRKLEKEEIIVLRKVNEKSKKILMTHKGKILIEQKMKPLVEMEERVLASWTEKERLKYLELLRRFEKQLEKEVKAYGK